MSQSENSSIIDDEHYSDGKYTIDKPLFKAGLISVLYGMLNNLNIMEIIVRPPSIETKYKLPETLEEKLENYENDENLLDYFDEEYQTMLNRFKMKLKINKFEEIITNCLNSLIKHDNFEAIVRNTEKICATEEDEKKLFRDHETFKETVKELKDTILKERRIGLMDIQKATDTIGTLKDKIEDIIFENAYKLRYVEKWEKANIEQYEYKNELEMKEYEKEIKTLCNNIQNEQEIFETVKNFYTLKMMDTKECLRNWHAKYEYDSQKADAENNCLKFKLQQQKNLLKMKTDIYNERKEKIEAYLEYKEKKRLEEEFLENLNKSATKIQAWWKGVMVRQGFGPYRKRKGKGKKDNGKKSKKKAK